MTARILILLSWLLLAELLVQEHFRANRAEAWAETVEIEAQIWMEKGKR